MENSKFGDRFRYAMKLRKMSQLKISEITGIAQGTLSNYAKNKYKPKEANLDLIANALNVSKSYLRGYTDNPDRLDNDGLQSVLDLFDQQAYMATHPVELNEEEYKLIEAYKQADTKTRKAIQIMLGLE